MADDGVVIVLCKIDNATREIVGNIQIESRGFVYSSEVRTIHTKIVDFVRKLYNMNRPKTKTVAETFKIVKDESSFFLNKLIGRSPMMIPMFVYVGNDAPINTLSDEASVIGDTIAEQG
jgi:mRNA degradation ribonuclease J1/J2